MTDWKIQHKIRTSHAT